MPEHSISPRVGPRSRTHRTLRLLTAVHISSKFALLSLVVPLGVALVCTVAAFNASGPSSFFSLLIFGAVASALSGFIFAGMSLLRKEPLWQLAVLGAVVSVVPAVLVSVGMAQYPQRV
jgi:uncharacterized BrkB/YihY/UPF0761 family membrane protein